MAKKMLGSVSQLILFFYFSANPVALSDASTGELSRLLFIFSFFLALLIQFFVSTPLISLCVGTGAIELLAGLKLTGGVPRIATYCITPSIVVRAMKGGGGKVTKM